MKYSGEIRNLNDLDCITKSIQQDSIKMNGLEQDKYQYFRGHESNNYKLIANISRRIQNSTTLSKIEKNIIKELQYWIKILLLKKIFYIPQNSLNFHPNWYWLTQIQHQSIPTRLLDWTMDSRVALFFVVNNKIFHNEDGDLWVFFVRDEFNISISDQQNIDPFLISKDFFISIPTHWNQNFESNEAQRRILGQQGKFFIREIAKTFTPLENDPKYIPLLRRFKIPSNCKKEILKSLIDNNYTEKTIYKSKNFRMKCIRKIVIKKFSL